MTRTKIANKNYVTVITDGSNKRIVDNIKLMFDLASQNKIGGTKCRPLSKAHPTTMVIETSLSDDIYTEVQEVIENVYPGLCIFNAIIA